MKHFSSFTQIWQLTICDGDYLGKNASMDEEVFFCFGIQVIIFKEMKDQVLL